MSTSSSAPSSGLLSSRDLCTIMASLRPILTPGANPSYIALKQLIAPDLNYCLPRGSCYYCSVKGQWICDTSPPLELDYLMFHINSFLCLGSVMDSGSFQIQNLDFYSVSIIRFVCTRFYFTLSNVSSG
ncbi:hypothetical protein CVS40_10483 [Lucilia cuprina]|nr:hypothetical protein CVS40_10483 [Lucilia cuprina]